MSYRGGRRLAAVLVLACVVAVIYQPGSSPARGSVRASRSEFAGAKMWCEARSNKAWRKVLNSGLVGLSRRASVVPLALANDERSFFAEIYTKAYSGVVEMNARTGRYTEIKSFPDPVNDQTSGSFDGRWLVWDEYHSLNGLDDFTVWSWDSRTGRLRQIGAATRSPGGVFWPSSWQAPVALNGYATWEQGAGENGLGDVHVVDLGNGRGRVVRRGHVGGSFLVDGSLVVWPESMKPGALTVMRAASATTGRAVATPLALRNLRGGLAPVTDGKALAYETDKWRSLWWSPSIDVAPRRVFSTTTPDFIDNWVHLAGRYVSFTVWHKAYLADTSSGRYIQISPGGDTHLGAKSLALSKPPKTKTMHALKDVVFLPLKSLPPIPPCE
jgi:hypothetical protein